MIIFREKKLGYYTEMASKDQIKLIFYSTAITIKIIKPSATQRLVFFIFFFNQLPNNTLPFNKVCHNQGYMTHTLT